MPVPKTETARGRKSTTKTAVKPDPAETACAAQAMPDEQRKEAICQAAYALYEARGCVYGHALEDWLEAEAQVEQALAGLPSGAAAAQSGH